MVNWDRERGLGAAGRSVRKGRWCLGVILGLALLIGLPGLAAALSGAVNINTATVEELQVLPFIGEVRARTIVEYRREHGPFAAIEDLLGSEAVGPRTLEAIRPYLALGGVTTLRRPLAEEPLPGAVTGPVSAKEPAGEDRAGVSVRRVIVTRPGEIQVLCDQDYYPVLLHFLQNADRRIELAMFVFRVTASNNNRPARIAEELIAARRRGVAVELLLENSAYDEDLNREHRRLADTLRRGGVTVRFGPQKTTTHNKMVLIDERFTLLGSHNLTHSALRFNHECSLLIDNHELAARLQAYLHEIQRP